MILRHDDAQERERRRESGRTAIKDISLAMLNLATIRIAAIHLRARVLDSVDASLPGGNRLPNLDDVACVGKRI